jgi:hypothetical protein
MPTREQTAEGRAAALRKVVADEIIRLGLALEVVDVRAKPLSPTEFKVLLGNDEGFVLELDPRRDRYGGGEPPGVNQS